ENLILAGQEHEGSMLSRLLGPRDAGLAAPAERMLGFFRLGHLADEPAGGLSYGQQKLLDAAMAVMAGPRLALLDQPAGGRELARPRAVLLGRPPPRAARRAGGRRQSDHAREPARPAQGDQR